MFIELSRPLEPLFSLQRALALASDAKPFDGLGESFTAGRSPLPVSVLKEGDSYVLVAELPGARKEGIEIEVKGDRVRLFGDRQPEVGANTAKFLQRERGFGKFDRSFELPYAIDAERVKAVYENGLLTVTLPPVAQEQPKKIAVA